MMKETEKKESNIDWLCNWYKNNCNSEWEHQYGIFIETLDNPGWSIIIDTEYSNFELNDIPWIFLENNPNDWYGYKIENRKYIASGDPLKLDFLISIFRQEIAKSNV